MPRSLILFALMACSAQAQVADKAAHASASALIATGLRELTGSQALALGGAAGVGFLKELADPVFSRGDLAADLLGACLAACGPRPDYIALLGPTAHTNYGDRTRPLRSFTPGVFYGWLLPDLPWRRAALELGPYSNSQGYSGFYAGLAGEWQVSGRLHAGVGAGVTYGYREFIVDSVPAGAPAARVLQCFNGMGGSQCIVERAGPPKWNPAARLSVRWQFDQHNSVVLNYMPAGLLARWLGHHSGDTFKPADAWTLGLRRDF